MLYSQGGGLCLTFSRSGTQAAGLGGDLFALKNHFGQPFPSPLPFLPFPRKGELEEQPRVHRDAHGEH